MYGAGAGSGDQIRVLYVDDDPDMTALTAELLEQEDDQLAVETEIKPAAGLDRLDEVSFECVISDYQMPSMNGLDFLRAVRKDRDSDVPFIIFTGKGREEVAMEALNLGADRYLQKGGDPRTQYGVLATAIRQTVERKRLETARMDAEKRFRSLFDNFPEPTFEYVFENGDPLIRDVNDAFEDVFGYGPDEAVGNSINELIVPPTDRDRAFEIDERVRAGELVDTTGVRQTTDGECPFRIRNIPLSPDDPVRGFVVYTDLPDVPAESR